MPDANKVIKGYTICVEHGRLNGEDCHGYHQWKDNHYEIEKINDYSKECPYNGCETGCMKTLKKDVLFLLKEQEAVKPVLDEQTGRIWLCGNCGSYVGFEDNDPHDPNEFDKYCRECGRPVLWEGGEQE